MLHVIVKLWPGKSDEQKQRLGESVDLFIAWMVSWRCGAERMAER